MTKPRLNPLILAIFSTPNFAFAFVVAPVTAFLPNIYATDTQVSLAAIGVVLMVSRVFDAVTDQLIGYSSDRTRSRFGPRKPWLMLGLPVMMISVPFLFNPPASADIGYFAVWSLMFYFGYTCVYVPHLAWASELSADYRERSRIFTFYVMAGQIGQFIVFGGPIVLFWMNVLPSSEMNASFMQVLTWAFLIIFPISIFLSVWKAPVGDKPATKPVDLRSVWRSLRANGVLQRYMATLLLYGLGQGMFASLIVVYFDSYMGLADRFPIVLVSVVVISFASLPPWMAIVNRFGKHRPWAISWIGSLLTMPLLALFPPGPASFIPILIIFLVWGFWEAVSNVVAQSLLADVVDYDILKTGADKAGSFFALQGLVVKFSAAFGAGFAFILLDVFHYTVGDSAASNTPAQSAGFLVVFIALPVALKLISIPLLWNFPIDQRRHGVIRRRLESRAARAQSAAPALLAGSPPAASPSGAAE